MLSSPGMHVYRLRYDSRSGTHNMYREYRDLSLAAAVTQMCKCFVPLHASCNDYVALLRAVACQPRHAMLHILRAVPLGLKALPSITAQQGRRSMA